MKTERKRVTLTGMIGEAQAGAVDLLVTRPGAWFDKARERMRNLPQTNFDLGCDFAEAGKWMDALFRFRVAAYFQPAYPQVWYNIGCSYFRLGKYAKAKEALLKALQQKPNHQDAIFMLAALDASVLPPNQRPTRMPPEMVQAFFSSIADGYDIVEARNKYQAGKLVHDLVQPLVKAASPAVLDLGCGTGIVSRPWRQAAARISGVELTPAMLALAGKATHTEKKLFDQLVAADITALPAEIAPESADVVLMVNVAQFVGELAGVMQGVARALTSAGVFVITYEPYAGSNGYGLVLETGRFGHSGAYVKQAASSAGLTLAKETTLKLYPELTIPALVFTKGGI